jgi:hypothetical protein
MTAILNKKVILAASMIVAVAAVALGATYAAWQGSAQIAGNTVSTVSMDILATGVAAYGQSAAPLVWEGAVPGETTDPMTRAEITNDGSTPMDLYMYLVPTGTCTATKMAWRSGVVGTGVFDYGFLGAVPTNVGTKAGAGDSNFALVSAINTPVKIADDSKFTPGAVIALQALAGFATDADYPADAGTCVWVEHFISTLPDVAPVII